MYLINNRACVNFSTCGFSSLYNTVLRFQTSTATLVQPDYLKGSLHRKHPGVTSLKTVQLPEALQQAALSVLQGAEIKSLTERSNKLTNFLWSRKRAIETAQLREKALLLERKFLECETNHKDDEHLLEARVRRKVLAELKRTTYHRTSLRYDTDLGLVYMAARLAGGYAAVLRALNEIKKRDPQFVPCSLLDFGSGLGTGTWASHSLWGESLKEYVCVDCSGDMNSLAEQLLRGGNETDDPFIKQVYLRQFLPISPKVQFDIVLAAFSLSELASLTERVKVVSTLWRKTNKYLVLVENGTKDGHQILMEARAAILKGEDDVLYDLRKPAVFAPCTHEKSCPKLFGKPVVPCNFPQFYHSLTLNRSQVRQQERFSYLIMSRSDEESCVTTGDLDMARLTSQVQRRVRHVQCQLCCSSGELKQLAITARLHGRDLYKCARSSDWGDLLPVCNTEEATGGDET